MKFVFVLVLMAITLLVVVSAESFDVENDALDILEGAREKKYAAAFESCGGRKCCTGCLCSCDNFDRCVCIRSFAQIIGLWRNWE
uniref:U25-Sparatoxin-Hju1a_1 n=1 Tax=Heteropoda jugulans TaxID=1358901 RepID=A0A4Q8KA47_9ARAC